MKPDVRVFDSLAPLSQAAAELICARAVEAVARHGRFTLSLSGGNTPRDLYRLLAQASYSARLPWDRTWIFQGDERFVPPNHPESNYFVARHILLARVPVPGGQVLPVPTETAGAEESARIYEECLRQLFAGWGEVPGGGFPAFDLLLLGVGQDGHTASLFSGDPALEEKERWVTAALAPPHYKTRPRISLTLPLINSAACVMILAAGRSKKQVVRRILSDPQGAAADIPAARVHPDPGELIWLLDRETALD
jgi:6-phosphogluconolactonase